MVQTQKHTQQLVDQFRHHLLNRRSDLYEQLHSISDSETKLIEIMLDEVNRIDSIFKLMEKGKI